MSYEGTFLVAVATAYFLAVNALAACLVLQLVQLRERLAEQESRLRAVQPALAQVARAATFTLDAGSASLKSTGRKEDT